MPKFSIKSQKNILQASIKSTTSVFCFYILDTIGAPHIHETLGTLDVFYTLDTLDSLDRLNT
jgi:hypothetical protein